MALHSDTEIYRAVVELQKFAMRAAVNMRRDVKPLLGERLVDESLWMAVLVRRANIARAEEKVPHLDQHVKHRLRARHYIRYVDDFVLLPVDPATWARIRGDKPAKEKRK